MLISDVLRAKGTQVITVTPDTTVRQLVAVLAEHRIGAVVVSHDGVAVDGIASERDVVQELARRGAAVMSAPVTAIYTAQVHTVTTAPGEWHWHGAARGTFMVHLAVSGGTTEWAEQVTDDEYRVCAAHHAGPMALPACWRSSARFCVSWPSVIMRTNAKDMAIQLAEERNEQHRPDDDRRTSRSARSTQLGEGSPASPRGRGCRPRPGRSCGTRDAAVGAVRECHGRQF